MMYLLTSAHGDDNTSARYILTHAHDAFVSLVKDYSAFIQTHAQLSCDEFNFISIHCFCLEILECIASDASHAMLHAKDLLDSKEFVVLDDDVDVQTGVGLARIDGASLEIGAENVQWNLRIKHEEEPIYSPEIPIALVVPPR